MKDRTTTTQPSVTSNALSHGVACPMLAVLALALLCSAPSTAQCVVGANNALEFGASGALNLAEIPPNTLFGGLGDFTVESWFLRQSTYPTNTGANQYQTILSAHAAGVRPIWIGFQTTPASQVFVSINYNPANNDQYGILCSNGGYADGSWHHIALTRAGSTFAIYIDGQPNPIGSTFSQNVPASQSLSGAVQPIKFGKSLSSNHQLFGKMDEVRIWNVARTQAQIQSTRLRGLTIAEAADANLVAYWRFDEGSGQTVFNSAAATGSALDGTLGANTLPGTDDPTWISTGLPPLPYCPACPNPPCGQVNSPCATLTVNGVGAAAQGPFNVIVPPAGTLSLNWSGPANQPYVLVATTNLVPGQVVAPPSFVVDVNIGNFGVLFSGFDPYWGPLFFTTAAGTNVQTFGVPSALSGSTLNVQGLIYDLANTCSGGVGLATTASFSIQL